MEHHVLQTRDGETLHFYETGAGAPVVFLHGWSTVHDLTEPLMERVGARYRTVAWDARGHGHHPYRLAIPPTIDTLTDDLEELLDRIGADRCRLVGHSMGAAVIWAYLQKYGTGRVSQTVIIDMTPRLVTDENWSYGVYFDFPPERQQWFLSEMQADMAEAVLRLRAYGRNAQTRALYERDDPALELYRQFLRGVSAGALISIWQSLLALDFRDLLSSLQVPTLLLYGGASQFYGRPLADWMLQTLPDAELVFFQEGEHAPHLQFPEATAEKMFDFFVSGPEKGKTTVLTGRQEQ